MISSEAFEEITWDEWHDVLNKKRTANMDQVYFYSLASNNVFSVFWVWS